MTEYIYIIVGIVLVAIGVYVYVKRMQTKLVSAYISSLPTRLETLDIVQYEEIRRYQASWDDWYVQIAYDGQIYELRFDSEPSSAELYDAVKALMDAEKEIVVVTLEAEDGEIV